VLQDFLDPSAAGRLRVPLHRAYALDDSRSRMRTGGGNAIGKLVVLSVSATRGPAPVQV